MPRPNEFPQILIFKEKRYEDTYLVNSREELNRIAVSKVRERAEIGYYEHTDPEKILNDREKAIDYLIEASGLLKEHCPRTVEELNELQNELHSPQRAARFLGVTDEVFRSYPAPVIKKIMELQLNFELQLPKLFQRSADDLLEAQKVNLVVHSEEAETLTLKALGIKSYANLAYSLIQDRAYQQYEGYEIVYPEAIPTAEQLEESRVKL